MASSQKPSRWGFLSQAVASVESKLDTILADDDESIKRVPSPAGNTKENIPPSRSSLDSTRTSTPTQSNDRLQERLARAMAKKNAGKPETATLASEQASRPTTPVANQSTIVSQSLGEVGNRVLSQTQFITHETPCVDRTKDDISSETNNDTSMERLAVRDNVATALEEATRASQDNLSMQDSSIDADRALLHAQLENDGIRTQMQDEIRGYVERIDALSAKLQYLAKEAAQSAKQASKITEPGTVERKLAEKDEKIALLVEEGHKLSVTEMKNLAIIKKLRSQGASTTKEHDAIRKKAEIAEQQLAFQKERAQKAEESARNAERELVTLNKATQNLEAVSREKILLQETITELRAQIAQANTRAENAELQAQSNKVEEERKQVAELKDDMLKVKLEHELAEKRSTHEIERLQAALNHEKDQSRAMETEMLAEQATLEGRLEAFRVKAEEASSNDQGDLHAKSLRQIEILQGQYAAASQNWQGIEGTLLARITSLEQDRDEVTAREIDIRKKLRDTISKSRSSESKFEAMQTKLIAVQEVQSRDLAEVQRLTRRNQQLEEDLIALQRDLEAQRGRLEREFARKLDEEKTKLASSLQQIKIESPNTSIRKPSVYAIDHLMSPGHPPYSRRSSALPSVLSETPARQYSSSSVKGLTNSAIPETPSIVTSPDEDYFDGVPATPISQDRHLSRRGVNDVISTSTVGGGPSVQLVERMSANVRRLESEKAASKDELIRLTAQRDEARQEVVQLMRDIDQKNQNEARLKQLEEKHTDLSQRYQTTLELLGEKSEQVDELKQDVADVKQMYRELVDHMK